MSYSAFLKVNRRPSGTLTFWAFFDKTVFIETRIPIGYPYQIEVNKRKQVYDSTQTFIAKGEALQ